MWIVPDRKKKVRFRKLAKDRLKLRFGIERMTAPHKQ